MLGTKTKKITRYSALVLALVVILISTFFIWLKLASKPVSPEKKVVFFTIKKGDSFLRVLNQLKKKNLIRSSKAAKFTYWWNNLTIKAGHYQLGPQLSLGEILSIFHEGREYLIKVTIPEGSNIYEIPQLLKEQGFEQTAKDFEKLASDQVFLSKNKIRFPSLEGYLFPSTYLLPKNISAQEFILTMLDTFQQKTHALLKGLSKDDQEKALIMASIIEKEAVVDQERPLIASVFYNRLKRGIKLQADPTVRYASRNFHNPIRRSQLRLNSPYNTYVSKGLPPSPICNPGLKSLEAALNPTISDKLFFVSKYDGTGEHYFSSTNREHINYRRLNDRKLKTP